VLEEGDLLVQRLWELFAPEIATGEPVRFCFSQDLLREHFSKSPLADRPVSDQICAVARGCFGPSGNKVLLVPGALTETSVGFSKAIVLVCQQVLAVEEMISEGAHYSENAYFPKLRRLMDPNLPAWSANPFSFDEFEEIWKTFAREVWSIAGSSDATVTFEFGAYEGANKARQFPLSQALFSSGDLAGVVVHCRLNRLRSASATDVWGELRRERYHLSRRAQRLINSGFLRERLIDQVRSFAERLSMHPTHATKEETDSRKNLSLFIGLDAVDGIQEEYFAFLVSDETGTRLANAAEVAKRIETILGRRGYVFCAFNKFGDGWTYYSGDIEIPAGDAIVLLSRGESIHQSKVHLATIGPGVVWDDARIRPLGADGAIFVAPIVVPRSLTLRGGVVVIGETSDQPVSPNFTWWGGICVDQRSSKYLYPYLPNRVSFGKKEFAIEELQRVSGSRMEWSALVNAISRLRTDVQYEMLFPGGYEARIAIAMPRESASERMGFLLDSRGRLSPTLERLGATDPAIVGFSCPSERVERPADLGTVAKLLMDLKSRSGRPLNDIERRIAWGRVSSSLAPASVKHVIKMLLNKSPLVQDAVLTELLDN
jgi:hypothetical protein